MHELREHQWVQLRGGIVFGPESVIGYVPANDGLAAADHYGATVMPALCDGTGMTHSRFSCRPHLRGVTKREKRLSHTASVLAILTSVEGNLYSEVALVGDPPFRHHPLLWCEQILRTLAAKYSQRTRPSTRSARGEEQSMFCNHCGKASPDDARLCAYCGAALTGSVAERRLVRPRGGRRIAGVCAGVAQYYRWNVTTIRLLWVLLFLFCGTGGLLYLILWIATPNEA